MSETRRLNPDEPYYEWGEYKGRLTIYSECCADSFAENEEKSLLAYLVVKHGGYVPEPPEGTPIVPATVHHNFSSQAGLATFRQQKEEHDASESSDSDSE